MASLFIGLAAVVDFFDGFIARWMKATSAIGAQLDSLADVVSFGVAPSLIVYQFLRLTFAQQDNGLDVNFIFLLPAFFIACAGAYRLARFNIDTTHTNYFKGLPIPANGLLIASFPLIYWTNNYAIITNVLISPWFWYAIDYYSFVVDGFKKTNAGIKIFKHQYKKINAIYNYCCCCNCFSIYYSMAGSAIMFLAVCYFIFVHQTTKISMTYNVQIKVMLLKDLLDPQGKAVQAGLKNLGLNSVNDVRIGKHITLQIDANSEEEAKKHCR